MKVSYSIWFLCNYSGREKQLKQKTCLLSWYTAATGSQASFKPLQVDFPNKLVQLPEKHRISLKINVTLSIEKNVLDLTKRNDRYGPLFNHLSVLLQWLPVVVSLQKTTEHCTRPRTLPSHLHAARLSVPPLHHWWRWRWRSVAL